MTNLTKKIYKISGMDCEACAKMIELDLEDIGIKSSCSYPKEELEIEIGNNFNEDELKKLLLKSGYVLNL